MSRNELIEAYQSGRISRRTFVRGMVGVGLSVTVATSMADQLRAAPAPATGGYTARFGTDDVYDDVYATPTPDPVTALPATGSGSSDGGSSNLMKPMAILGAGAAIAAGALRRFRGAPEEAE